MEALGADVARGLLDVTVRELVERNGLAVLALRNKKGGD